MYWSKSESKQFYLSYLIEVLLFNRKRFNKYFNVGKDTLILISWRMLFQT